MTWELFYLVCFVLGLALCALSLFTGVGHVHTGHVHVHTPHVHTHAGGTNAANALSPVNGFTITAFLCWFGGTGYLLRTHSMFFGPLILLISMVSGLGGAGLIFWFLGSVLLPKERVLTAEDTQITGVLGRVTDALQPGRTGEILYSQMGVRRSAPARSDDGSSIGRGSEVIVLRYERGIAYVRPWRDIDL